MDPAHVVFACEAALLGGATASFLCVVAERLPRGETLGGRSHCACGRQLTWYENIPILSWVLMRGRAGCCGTRIPVHYLLAEAALTLTWGGAVFAGMWGWPIAAAGAAGVYLVARRQSN